MTTPPSDLARYHRQMLLPGIGESGQQRLRASTGLIVGCGALGTHSAEMLVRAGVGRVVLVDRDFVEWTNLQRQGLFDEQDIADALPKAEAARRKLARINSDVEVVACVQDVTHESVDEVLSACGSGPNVIVDGLDNFETRYLINDLAVQRGMPYVYGGAVGTVGASMTVLPRAQSGDSPWRPTPCLRCIFEETPSAGPTCDTAGVLGPVVAWVANVQAAEAIKVLVGAWDAIQPRLLNVDLWNNDMRSIDLSNARQDDCVCCGQRQFEYLDGEHGSRATKLCGRDAVQIRRPFDTAPLDLPRLADRMSRSATVVANEFMLRATVEYQGGSFELNVFPDGRAIVKGTNHEAVARSIYDRFIGT